MAKRVVGVTDFKKSVVDLLQTYTDDVVEAVNEEVVDTSQDGADLLKNVKQPDASKTGTAKPMKRRTWNAYAKSWTSTAKKGTNFVHTSIHNKKHYRLTHLLEYGHATRNGTHTRAFRHIEPVEIYCDEQVTKNLKKIIEKGGKV